MVTASGARLVIRGEAGESNGLDQEAWFLARAGQAGVPVPEVLWLRAVDTTAGPRAVLGADGGGRRALSGALPGMSAGQRWSAARSCGQVIARPHSVRVGGFYRRHADGSFEFADVAALRAADLANRLDNLRVLAGAGLIDFGDACGGRPLDDLASLCWEWPGADRAALAAGYGPVPRATWPGSRPCSHPQPSAVIPARPARAIAS